MAVDPEKFRNLRKNLDDIVELAPGDSGAENLIVDTVLGKALRETEGLMALLKSYWFVPFPLKQPLGRTGTKELIYVSMIHN
mgnify:CR=1 FL=1